MKKVLFLIVSIVILGLVFAGCGGISNITAPSTTTTGGMTYVTKGGPTVNEADEFDLYAGQNILVGKVLVWNDADNLYVKYLITDPDWCLTETHLHVAASMEEIPQKNGNPIPGKFDYKGEHECESEVDYVIPLPEGTECDNTLVIAAHAVVSDAPRCAANGVMYTTRISGGTKGLYEVDVVNGTSTLLKAITGSAADVGNTTGYTNGLAYDPFNHMLYFTAPSSVLATTSPLYSYDIASETLTYLFTIQGPVVGASFYDGAYYYMVEKTNQLMKVEVNSGNDVTVACSGFGTASDFTFGDFAISSAGILYGSTRVNKMFFSLDMNTCTYNEFADSNALDLQLAFGSDGKLYGINNANGYSYVIDEETGVATQLSFTFVGVADMASGELCVPNTETAWGGIGEFSGKNWARYITYIVDCPGKLLVVTQQNPSCTVSFCPDEEERSIVESYLDDLDYPYDSIWEPTGGLTSIDLEEYDVVIYLSWSYPAGYANLSTAKTLIDYFESGGRLIVVGDDISRVGNAGGHPYQAQNSTYGDDWEAMTRLDYENNGGSQEVGITDGYQITLGSGHPVLSGIEGETFTYYNDCDTTSFMSGTGATELATSSRNSSTPKSDLSGGTAITAYDNDTGKIVTIDVNFYGGYYNPVGPVDGPAIPETIAKTLLGNSINWLYY